ncbi:tRNA (adenosine(37)-N6)-dimethylallyltransferase MiaA [Dermatophilus congolensis]|nr:tRNA (adenosine(37)-N6)-dimethylallyltransferase MiaA [Dermatophilus congolensis]MBO3132148.1 tRNA (adenosine(37)-N6)-dimethylallyltransferase MiaA [Dermatophilus congolensis]MBO3133696.1 tRNA (adenosine(37)-N6)-dimethylallyltransferase MiaA [Dermatophilus congolensis]MBO3135929.1 tRNA (adenosine(37)-N6)-dimethylallyltransferase MiaA [Dermatophilus congolensis]MBO3138169.1 tRNA (adenosine(37)-N6)-dimethylallyltransferase MiaA [Dermatophilus congolensis]
MRRDARESRNFSSLETKTAGGFVTELVPQVVAVVGPTATGKTALAVRLAEQLGGEIVNADAFALYAGMDIGTAKPTNAERGNIPHHQIDVLDIADDASVAAYQRHVRTDIDGIIARGNLPVLVGGSGLYVRAAIDVLEIPPTDPRVRARWEAHAATEGTPALYQKLTELDPQAAAAIEPRNTRRIVRALEVIELTGRPFSATMPRREFVRPTVMLGLHLDRDLLDTRIETRVRDMWRAGLLEEVAALEQRGLSQTRTASRAVGYREALAQLSGSMSEEEAIEATTVATRRLARRQISWFTPDPRITWIDAHDPSSVLPAALAALQQHGLSSPAL